MLVSNFPPWMLYFFHVWHVDPADCQTNVFQMFGWPSVSNVEQQCIVLTSWFDLLSSLFAEGLLWLKGIPVLPDFLLVQEKMLLFIWGFAVLSIFVIHHCILACLLAPYGPDVSNTTLITAERIKLPLAFRWVQTIRVKIQRSRWGWMWGSGVLYTLHVRLQSSEAAGLSVETVRGASLSPAKAYSCT